MSDPLLPPANPSTIAVVASPMHAWKAGKQESVLPEDRPTKERHTRGRREVAGILRQSLKC